MLYLSGQRPQRPDDGTIPDGVAEQAEQVLTNLTAVLRSCGCTLADVVKVQLHLADIADFEAVNGVYTKHFREPFPARTTVGSQLRGIRVEIDLIAALPAAAE